MVLDACRCPSDLVDTRRLLELASRLLEAQVELLLLQLGKLFLELVGAQSANICGFHELHSLLCDTLHEARLDRELGSAEAKCFAGELLVDTVDLEHHAAGLDLACPVFDRTLALTHADFGRLCRDRNVGNTRIQTRPARFI